MTMARETIKSPTSWVLWRNLHLNTLEILSTGNDLTELWGTELPGPVRLDELCEARQVWNQEQPKRTLDVSAVNPAEFSLVWRSLCGPGFGFCPFENAFNIFFVVSAVRSSCGRGLISNK